MSKLLIDVGSTYFKVCQESGISQYFSDFKKDIYDDLKSNQTPFVAKLNDTTLNVDLYNTSKGQVIGLNYFSSIRNDIPAKFDDKKKLLITDFQDKITIQKYDVMSVDKSPVYNVKAIPVEKIQANDYNPNVVAPPEMKLLELSIWEDGFTMPCVCYYDEEEDNYILVDGYHRYQVLKTSKRIYQRENGLLPVVVIDKELSNRMASTIRHNRARGTHNIELMCHIVAELDRAGMSDEWIMKNIGMDRDEVLRLKQISGLADLFANKNFSIPDKKEEYVADK